MCREMGREMGRDVQRDGRDIGRDKSRDIARGDVMNSRQPRKRKRSTGERQTQRIERS